MIASTSNTQSYTEQKARAIPIAAQTVTPVAPRAVKPGPRLDPTDLRRRHKRDIAAILVQRSDFLPAIERAAVLAIFRDGLTVKSLAYATLAAAPRSPQEQGTPERGVTAGRGESAARSLRRKLRMLTRRLLSPKFEFVISHLQPADQQERQRLGLPCWPPLRRKVAEACIVRGLTLREAARSLGVSLHNVRREMSAIQALFEARRS